MKVLFLANRVPFPPYRGDKLKIYNLAKRLAYRHELHLLTFAQTPEDLTYGSELEKIFSKVHLVYLPKWKSALNCLTAPLNNIPFQVLYFRSSAMKKALGDVLSKDRYDAIHVQHLRMAQYLENRKDLKRILDLPDAFSLYWKRKQEVPRNLLLHWFEKMEQRRVLGYESVIKEYNRTLVCSGEDKAYLEATHHATNIQLLPNGVDTSTFKAGIHDYTHSDTLLFTGNMDYKPNVDAVVYFTNEILPLIAARVPEVKFIIAGQRPVPKVSALASDRVMVTGFVKDLAEVYNRASVVVAPLRFGAGTQNKVLEAMAMGVPVVCSHIGFKGLGIASGQGAIMQTEPTAFAESVVSLLKSEALRWEVGIAGSEVIQSKFSWDIIAGQLETYLEEVARG